MDLLRILREERRTEEVAVEPTHGRSVAGYLVVTTCRTSINLSRNMRQAHGQDGVRLKLSARSADSLSARIKALQCWRRQAVRAPGLQGLAHSFYRTRQDVRNNSLSTGAAMEGKDNYFAAECA